MNYVCNAIALLIIAVVMLQSNIYSKKIAYIGLASGVFMLIPSTVGMIGLIFSHLSLMPWVVFSILVARRLFQLGSMISKELPEIS